MVNKFTHVDDSQPSSGILFGFKSSLAFLPYLVSPILLSLDLLRLTGTGDFLSRG